MTGRLLSKPACTLSLALGFPSDFVKPKGGVSSFLEDRPPDSDQVGPSATHTPLDLITPPIPRGDSAEGSHGGNPQRDPPRKIPQAQGGPHRCPQGESPGGTPSDPSRGSPQVLPPGDPPGDPPKRILPKDPLKGGPRGSPRGSPSKEAPK